MNSRSIVTAMACALMVGLPGLISPASASANAGASVRSTRVGDPRVLDDVRFRKQFGLRSDIDYVNSLYAAARAHPHSFNPLSWGALLTPAETADMLRRQRMAEAVEATASRLPMTAFRHYIGLHQAEFAGMSIDQLAGGVVTVRFTGHVAEHAAALARLVPYPNMLRVVAASHSESDLVALRDAVTAHADELARSGLTVESVGPNEAANDVEVRTDHPTAVQAALLRDLFPGQPLTLVPGSPSTATGGHVQNAPPARGGQWIQSCGTTDFCLTIFYCTTAFVVEDGTGAFYAATAGHCGGVRSGWLQDKYFLGVVTQSQYGGSTNNDAGLISIRSTDKSKQIFIQQRSCGFLCTENDYRNVGSEESSPTQGEVTCLAGSTSDGEHCANDSSVNQCLNEKDDNGNLHFLCGMVIVNGYTGIPGDSGGSWYQPQSNGTSMAQGIQSGSYPNNGGSVYEFITYGLIHLPGGGGSYFVYT